MTLETTEELEGIETADPLTGRVLDGRFRLESVIGKGGMGAVYRAKQLSVDRDVAVKLFRRGQDVTETLEARFFREAKVMSQFSHPNIVQLIDFGSTPDGILYLAMELVDGEPLDRLLDRGRLTAELSAEVVKQVCLGLSEAHGHGVVHRDLKASNLILSTDRAGMLRVRILDFGIAYPRHSEVKITRTGLLSGTPAYLAPEQARAKELDGRADLYSLGIVLFEMLSGTLPFSGDTMQVMFKHVQEPPPDLSVFASTAGIPPDLITLMEDLVQKSPNDRPDDAVAVLRRLGQLGLRAPVMDSENPFQPLIKPKLEPSRAPKSTRTAPNQVIEGSSPFTEADDEVKGAWAAFLDASADNLNDMGRPIDPNVDYLHPATQDNQTFDPHEDYAATTKTKAVTDEDLLDMSSEWKVTDAVKNAPPPRTGRMAGIQAPDRPVDHTPRLGTQRPSRTAPAHTPIHRSIERPMVAPETTPRRTATNSDTTQASNTRRSRDPRILPLTIVVLLIVAFAAVAYLSQRKGFAPEEDTLTREAWDKYKEEAAAKEQEPEPEPEVAVEPRPKTKQVPRKKQTKRTKSKDTDHVIDLFEANPKDNDDPFEIQNKE